jgi:enediyne biosynthesis protein E4
MKPAQTYARPTRFYLLIAAMFLTAWLVTGLVGAEPESCSIRLINVTNQTGITFRHHHGGSGEGYIVEGVSAGLASFDFDGDGNIDLYFLNGAALQGTEVEAPLRNALYRNQGDWTFKDVSQVAGVDDLGHGLGVTAGDFDNDGFQDLYLNNFGPNVLYRNNGDGTFTDVTVQAGVDNGNKVGAGVSFLDIDGDGNLDLFVSNYVDFTYENHVPIIIGDQRFHAGPRYYRPEPDTLFRNHGDGTFADVSVSSGVAAVAGPSMGMICLDYDDDGDTDVFVVNDEAANFLFRNDGRGNFTEVGLIAGLAYDFYGKENSSMGVDCGDFDHDGLLDLFMTDYQSEMPVLYRNLGGGLFDDATNTARISNELFPHVTWGTGFVDFDNDGDLDLYVACGHFDRIETIDDRTAHRVPNLLLMNTGDGKFVDVSRWCGNGLTVAESSRGTAFDDLDNNGLVDVVVLNSHAPPTILRNESSNDHRWLQIQLRGGTSNRDGVGSRVRVVAGDLVRVAEVHSGRGYQSHHGSRLHFGLGQRKQVDRIEVRWLGGAWEAFPSTAADQVVVLVEGAGEASDLTR